MTNKPKFPEHIKATGSDGNIFAVIEAMRGLMRKHEIDEETIDKTIKTVAATNNYTDALNVVREWFTVDTIDWTA